MLGMRAHRRRGTRVEHREMSQCVTQRLDVLMLRWLELHDDERGVIEFRRDHGAA